MKANNFCTSLAKPSQPKNSKQEQCEPSEAKTLAIVLLVFEVLVTFLSVVAVVAAVMGTTVFLPLSFVLRNIIPARKNRNLRFVCFSFHCNESSCSSITSFPF